MPAHKRRKSIPTIACTVILSGVRTTLQLEPGFVRYIDKLCAERGKRRVEVFRAILNTGPPESNRPAIIREFCIKDAMERLGGFPA